MASSSGDRQPTSCGCRLLWHFQLCFVDEPYRQFVELRVEAMQLMMEETVCARHGSATSRTSHSVEIWRPCTLPVRSISRCSHGGASPTADDYADIFGRLLSPGRLSDAAQARARVRRTLGRILRDRAWSRYELAKACTGNCTPKPIYDYFDGVQEKARIKTRKAIAEALGISLLDVPE